MLFVTVERFELSEKRVTASLPQPTVTAPQPGGCTLRTYSAIYTGPDQLLLVPAERVELPESQ